MAGGIFVSYRRDDTRQAAGRMADDLATHFGSEHIFRDIEGIDLGVEFAKALNRALETCVVMLVLIGPRWLDITDAQGRRRLDDPRDWIRQEIATALSRDIRVVPVLIDGTALPDEADLPEDLRPLVRRQALEIADTRWRGDLQRLVETLARLPGLRRKDDDKKPDPPEGSKKPLWTGIAIGVFGLLAVAGYVAEPEPVVPVPPEPVYEPPVEPTRPVEPPRSTHTDPDPDPDPAPAPVADPDPVAVPDAPAEPNLGGLWRTLSGETYEFSQQGKNVLFTAQMAGQPAGRGEGRLNGSVLRLGMWLTPNGVPMGKLDCELQASPDFSRFVGMCQGPTGQFPAQMFR